ncbi:MAG: hypothetical protein LBH14_06660 [Desulfobulbaceae bacterium]|nr:hypothetical protein [Desulfobulbaceae bacterium]
MDKIIAAARRWPQRRVSKQQSDKAVNPGVFTKLGRLFMRGGEKAVILMIY